MHADTEDVRQITPVSNLLLSILAGLGLLASLSLPWYAAPASDPSVTDGPIERGAYQVGQVFSSSAKGMVSGNDALGDARMALFGLVALVVTLAAGVCVPALRRAAEDTLRVVALAIPVVLLIVAFAHPGDSGALHLHYGLLVAFVAALLMASAAWHGATMRPKKSAPTRRRYGTAAR